MIYEFKGRVKKLSLGQSNCSCEFTSDYKGKNNNDLAKKTNSGNYIVLPSLTAQQSIFDFICNCRDEKLYVEFEYEKKEQKDNNENNRNNVDNKDGIDKNIGTITKVELSYE